MSIPIVIEPVVCPTDFISLARLEEIVELVNKAYSRHNWLFPNPRTTLEDFRQEAVGADVVALTTRVGTSAERKIIATALVRPVEDRNSEWKRPDLNLYLEMFAVEPTQQGRGRGSHLLIEIERLARQRGYHKITLFSDVESGNADYYPRHGYSVVSEELKPARTWGALTPYRVRKLEKEVVLIPSF